MTRAETEAIRPPLLVEREDAVVTLVTNDPPRNRMGLDSMDALEAEVGRIEEVRASARWSCVAPATRTSRSALGESVVTGIPPKPRGRAQVALTLVATDDAIRLRAEDLSGADVRLARRAR